MVRDELSVMSAFLAVADERSFTKAAKRLGVTQSALSHAIRGLALRDDDYGAKLKAAGFVDVEGKVASAFIRAREPESKACCGPTCCA